MQCIYTAVAEKSRAGPNDVSEKPQKKKTANKDAQLILRLDKDERDDFVALCRELDTTAAREIRHFIRKFMKKNAGKS
ncbi:hypothetical protein MAA5396_01225 [Marinovum algicola]|jgi:hypothetical protein|uniref:Uncharacterized protein n=1 Tax=Marinovum algicola TaxID=42444 RepID=A0A975W6J6_9RHOB|nr:hypothetical protein SAMN04487940_101232 [Marinovum algicola]SLN28492.1 hypothetical protein MAA5396_01225 [Marinovum algicola]